MKLTFLLYLIIQLSISSILQLTAQTLKTADNSSDTASVQIPTYGPFPRDWLTKEKLKRIEGKRSDIYLNDISLSWNDKDKYVVLAMLSSRDSSLVEEWLSGVNLSTLSRKPVEFVNFVFPGGLFFMIPRKKALGKIRERIESEERDYLNNMNPQESRIYQELKVSWIADFTANTWAQLELDKNKGYLFLIAPDGRILERVKSQNRTELKSLLESIGRIPTIEESK